MSPSFPLVVALCSQVVGWLVVICSGWVLGRGGKRGLVSTQFEVCEWTVVNCRFLAFIYSICIVCISAFLTQYCVIIREMLAVHSIGVNKKVIFLFLKYFNLFSFGAFFT